MSLSPEQIAALAARLAEAERTRVPTSALTADHPELTREEAYAVQQVNLARRQAAGERLCGHKIGLTAKPIREQFGIDEPDYGHLFAQMFELEASEVPLDKYIAPMIEVEPAFILNRRLEGPGLTVADVIRATECVLPSFEIIDSRIRDWQIKIGDTIADNGSSGGVVLGARPLRLIDLDLRAISAELSINGEQVVRGFTSSILGSPVNAVTWLANKLGQRGVALEEGHVVLSGTCVRAIRLERGMEVRAAFDLLGDVTVSFV